MPHVSGIIERFLSVSSLFYWNPHHPSYPHCHNGSDPVLLMCILIFTLYTFSFSVFYFYFPLVCLHICLHACVSVYSIHVEAWRSQKMDLQPTDRSHRWLGGPCSFREWTEFFWESSRCSLLLSSLSRSSLFLFYHSACPSTLSFHAPLFCSSPTSWPLCFGKWISHHCVSTLFLVISLFLC